MEPPSHTIFTRLLKVRNTELPMSNGVTRTLHQAHTHNIIRSNYNVVEREAKTRGDKRQTGSVNPRRKSTTLMVEWENQHTRGNLPDELMM